MKRLAAVFAAAALLCGCAAHAESEAPGEADKLKVIATVFPPYDFAREIAGDRADVRQLLPPGAESHTFEPSPRDIIDIQQCDLFIYTGGESDVWIEDILGTMGPDAPKTLRLTDCVELLAAETTEETTGGGRHHGEEEHHHHGGYDEHVWTSPENAALIAEAICGQMALLDGENADHYAARTQSYTAQLRELDSQLTEAVQGAARQEIVVGDRFPFLYLTRRYGIDYHAAFPACGSEGDASAATVAFLTERVKERGIPAVLYIEFSNRRTAGAIAESAGVKTALLHSCHNVSQQEKEQGASYITLMRQNLETLKEVLN